MLLKARRNKVGCLIVKDGSIISDGYNGMPRGFDNNCEVEVEEYSMLASQAYKLVTRPEVLHAESNAITKLAKAHNQAVDPHYIPQHHLALNVQN